MREDPFIPKGEEMKEANASEEDKTSDVVQKVETPKPASPEIQKPTMVVPPKPVTEVAASSMPASAPKPANDGIIHINNTSNNQVQTPNTGKGLEVMDM